MRLERVSEKTNRNCGSCADPGTRGRNGERGRIHGADFVTRSNYFVTNARQIGDSGACRSRLSLQDATGSSRRSFDRSVRQHRLFQPPFNPVEGKVSNRDVCRHFDRVDRRTLCRAEPFRLGLNVRLTPLLQIDGYPTSTVPGCADRSVLTDST